MRYARLLYAQVRMSLLASAAYRVDFLVDGVIEILWTSTALAPLLVVFGHRASVAGWSFGEALTVVAFFTLLQALLEGLLNPSFAALVEHVQHGTFDTVLVLPVDAQFMVSTGRFLLWRAVNVATALGMFFVAFRAIGRVPPIGSVVLATLLFAAAIVMLHSIWTIAMCSVFFAVRSEQLTDVLSAILDASRWPSSIFRGATRLALTFVVPLGLMTTVPAAALLGKLEVGSVAASMVEAVVLVFVARVLWCRALAHYTSAGG